MRISKETFSKMGVEDKLNVLFDYADATVTAAKEAKERTERLEKTAMKWGGAGGVLAGIAAWVAAIFMGHIVK